MKAQYFDELTGVTTANGIYMALKLEIDGMEKDILLKYPRSPDGYIDTSKGAARFKIQLEKDIMLYFIPFKETFPVKNRSQLIRFWE